MFWLCSMNVLQCHVEFSIVCFDITMSMRTEAEPGFGLESKVDFKSQKTEAKNPPDPNHFLRKWLKGGIGGGT